MAETIRIAKIPARTRALLPASSSRKSLPRRPLISRPRDTPSNAGNKFQKVSSALSIPAFVAPAARAARSPRQTRTHGCVRAATGSRVRATQAKQPSAVRGFPPSIRSGSDTGRGTHRKSRAPSVALHSKQRCPESSCFSQRVSHWGEFAFRSLPRIQKSRELQSSMRSIRPPVRRLRQQSAHIPAGVVPPHLLFHRGQTRLKTLAPPGQIAARVLFRDLLLYAIPRLHVEHLSALDVRRVQRQPHSMNQFAHRSSDAM